MVAPVTNLDNLSKFPRLLPGRAVYPEHHVSESSGLPAA
ncbi:hypothetical protein L1280_000790 [Deinococcus sp. HSC-46F16]|nr:hypothetical protein [Deinococcus sp. HSC-46F16]